MNIDKGAALVVSVIVLAMFASAMVLVLTQAIPQSSERVADVMLGYLGGMATAVVAYWVGSSAGSAKKTELLAQAPPVQPGA